LKRGYLSSSPKSKQGFRRHLRGGKKILRKKTAPPLGRPVGKKKEGKNA